MVKTVSSSEEYKTAIASDRLTVVDFYATWCGPCKQIAPVLQRLSEEKPAIQFLKVDVDELEDVAQAEKITAMPTFKLYKAGALVAEMLGADSKKLIALIEQHA